ncbi:MAG: NUDIX hydrolase [Candidatus Nanopelagicales bacterium]
MSVVRERALLLASGSQEWIPPVPRPASTLVLVRDGESGVETFLMRRPLTMRFAPGMSVYPGGALDEADFDAAVTAVLDSEFARVNAARASASESEFRALLACAIRETREEAGIEFADAHDVVLTDHWVTPEHESRRFDVRFFLARIPEGQTAYVASSEADHAEWIRPGDALDRYSRDELPMLRPTLEMLRFLADFASAEDAIAAARSRTVIARMPRATPVGDSGLSWHIVNERTGEIIDTNVVPPAHLETGGISR